MCGILKKLLCGVLVFLYAASFVMLAYTSVNAESVTEKIGLNPSEPCTMDKMPSSLLAERTAAPAPSPKSTQVLRSVQSIIFDSVSAPITSAC